MATANDFEDAAKVRFSYDAATKVGVGRPLCDGAAFVCVCLCACARSVSFRGGR